MRTTKGAARTKAKRRMFKKAKGYRGGRGSLTRTVKETLIRAGVFAYRDRRVRKREFRKLWIIRINAGIVYIHRKLYPTSHYINNSPAQLLPHLFYNATFFSECR